MNDQGARAEYMILVAEDQKTYREHLCRLLQTQGYGTCQAATPNDLIKQLSSRRIDLVTLDLGWPEFEVSGIDLLKRIQEIDPLVPVIILTGEASTRTAVEATRLGALDYLEKIADQDRILVTLRNALASGRLKRAAHAITEDKLKEYEIVGASRAIAEVRSAILKFGPADVPVLIEGETGCGKELVARQLHLRSRRADRVFKSITAAMAGNELGADTLFGHSKGAFTGSSADRKGMFGSTDGGTLCLDDIVTLPMEAQPLLLRFLEGGEYYRLGSDESVTADVRILAATNLHIPQLIDEGHFRKDLYFRLTTATIVIPPLRERKDDIPLLVSHFVQKHSFKYLGKQVSIQPTCLELFVERAWPGNVRELENTVIRLLLSHGTTDTIECEEVIELLHATSESGDIRLGSLRDMEGAFRRACLIRALASTNGNVSRAADALGIERTHLHRLINEYDLAQYVKQLAV